MNKNKLLENMTTLSVGDELLDTLRRELYSAVIGDIMDRLGYTNQLLPPQIRPLRNDMVIAGRAFPVLESDIEQVRDDALLEKPFGLMLEALDDLKKNDIYICTGASPNYAVWGELMSTRAKKLGSAGAVLDGYSRDTKGILEQDFPTFSYGSYAQDQAPRGKVVAYRVPIKIDGVLIKPGDLIFGDMEGVCIIPNEIETQVIEESLNKAREEKRVQNEIKKGMSACEAFARYGVM